MKVFQIIGGICYWDASSVIRRAADADSRFEADMLFADAPDYVYEGWGFDASAEGDARFIQPTPPEGWLYDHGSGTFYEDGTNPPSEIKRTPEQIAAENIELKSGMSELEKQLTETQLALCDIYENMLLLIGG